MDSEIIEELKTLVEKYAKEGCHCDILYGMSCTVHREVREDLNRINRKIYDEKDRIKKRFFELLDEWEKETGGMSSPTQIYAHPAHLSIIALGPEVITIILEEMQRGELNHWFGTLRALTGVNLEIPEENKGRIGKIAEQWIHWGIENGYIKKKEPQG